MKKFMITTDGNSDFTPEYARELDIRMLPLYYEMDGNLYGGPTAQSPEEFYADMRNGKMPTTMAVNPDEVELMFRKLAAEGFDILHIAFSSGLSGSYSISAMAAEKVCEDLPDAKIIVIDSLCASLGQGLLVYKAAEMRKKGATIEETAQWVEENKLHICHQFTVDDLYHLHRGGRVSKTTAVVGTLVHVKPVLHVDDEGKLVSVGTKRGRKKAVESLVDKMAETIGKYRNQNDIVFISHGDCIEDAKHIADLVKERFGITRFHIDMVNPTIGAHSGPGTVALFYLGEKR